MWLKRDLKNYFKKIGQENLWDEKIFVGIKQSILSVVLTSLESMVLTNNTFELNGADFMIGFDGEPILLEVNCNPDLSFSTEATREICTSVMQDLAKGLYLSIA